MQAQAMQQMNHNEVMSLDPVDGRDMRGRSREPSYQRMFNTMYQTANMQQPFFPSQQMDDAHNITSLSPLQSIQNWPLDSTARSAPLTSQPVVPIFCSLHGRQLEYFCYECNFRICSDCIRSLHAAHKFDPVNSLMQGSVQNL